MRKRGVMSRAIMRKGGTYRADLDANTRKVVCSHPQMVTTDKDADDAIF